MLFFYALIALKAVIHRKSVWIFESPIVELGIRYFKVIKVRVLTVSSDTLLLLNDTLNLGLIVFGYDFLLDVSEYFLAIILPCFGIVHYLINNWLGLRALKLFQHNVTLEFLFYVLFFWLGQVFLWSIIMQLGWKSVVETLGIIKSLFNMLFLVLKN